MSAFPEQTVSEAARSAYGVLHRIDWHAGEQLAVLLVQSQTRPDWSRLPRHYTDEQEGIQVKSLEAALGRLTVGLRLSFRLRANPTRKVGTASKTDRLAGKRDNGQRLPVPDDAKLDWLRRKSAAHGFRLLGARWRNDGAITGLGTGNVVKGGRRGQRLTFCPVVFDGELEVTDVAAFRRALETGIGPAKAYGFGLLSIAHGNADQ